MSNDGKFGIMNTARWILLVSLGFSGLVRGEEWKEIQRLIPPEGIEVPEDELQGIRAGLAEAEKEYEAVKGHALAADAEVFLKSVRYALLHGEFYKKGDVEKVEKVLAEGARRVAALKKGETPWTVQRGLVVRGYRSEIDGSAQPYGLEIPEGLDLSKPARLYVWLHGRGDKTTDAHFIAERMAKAGQFPFEDGIVVHPFGRQCIGWKSAGEIDVLDVVDEVDAQYGIDRGRVALMGFSMGGAGAWHIGAHYAERWAAVHAGAGFAETARYTKLKEEDYPSETEQLMWRLYDVPNYARNLLNVPVIAYSGEEDKQIQAALVMEEALKEQGLVLPHVIGKGMGHKYDEAGKKAVMEFVRITMNRRRDPLPKKVHLQTRTLRYPSMHWVKVTGMVEPYGDTRVDAVLGDDGVVRVKTANVSALELNRKGMKSLELDDESRLFLKEEGDFPVPVQLVRGKVGWEFGVPPEGNKKPGLQGPIDDAFMEPFLVVVPDGKSVMPAFDRWVEFEVAHLEKRWRELFRGDLRMKKASEVTEEDIATYHLVAFGDGGSNSLINKMLRTERLAKVIGMGRDTLWLRGKVYDGESLVPLLIQPNPLNPNKYLVLNSGPTFREDHDKTNSMQNPKLGDWAVIDIQTPPNGSVAGKVVASGVFGPDWK